MTTATDDLDAAFDGGFDEIAPAQPVSHSPAEPEAVAPATPEAGEVAQAAAPAPAEHVQPTRAEWDAMQAALKELNQFRGNVDRRINTLGSDYGHVKRALQENVSKGAGLSPETFKALKEKWPELGDDLEAAFLNKSVEAVQGLSQAEVDKMVQAKTDDLRKTLREEMKAEAIHERLSDAHEDYVDVLRSKEFVDWCEGLSHKRAKEIQESNDPKFMIRAITDFKTRHQQASSPAAPAAPAAAPRPDPKARLQAAIAPTGTPRTGAPSKTEQDYFDEGFGKS